MTLDQAAERFNRSPGRCPDLIAVHRQAGEGAPGKRTDVSAINPTAIVLAMGSWQAVVQNLTNGRDRRPAAAGNASTPARRRAPTNATSWSVKSRESPTQDSRARRTHHGPFPRRSWPKEATSKALWVMADVKWRRQSQPVPPSVHTRITCLTPHFGALYFFFTRCG